MRIGIWAAVAIVCCFATILRADDEATLETLDVDFLVQVNPLITQYCIECHSGDTVEASIDFDMFSTLEDVRKHVDVWQKIHEAISLEKMPPSDAPQPTAEERAAIQDWLSQLLTLEASRLVGDPGPIVLRRLSNAEYTNSIRAITGVSTLEPAREFPVDGASGEGFTSAGNGLVMSSALLEKYMAAGKEIASHAVLLPSGIRFSPSNSRADWAQGTLTEIRSLYAKYSTDEGATKINLQGEIFDTNQGGRLPLDRYLRATIEERSSLTNQTKSIDEIAKQRSLSPKYLRLLWKALQDPQSQTLKQLSGRWKSARVDDIPALLEMVHQWQKTLWTFSSVGHIGKANGPKSWMTPLNPIQSRQEFRVKMPAVDSQTGEAIIYLVADDAGDGSVGDVVTWERPRIVAPGRPDILLKDCAAITGLLAEINGKLLQSMPQALAAADWVMKNSKEAPDDNELAKRFECDAEVLNAWFEYLGVTIGGAVEIQGHLSRNSSKIADHDFVGGWVGDDALSVVANSSDDFVRIPGDLEAHSIAVHPSPTMSIVVGWQSPVTENLRIHGLIRHAHPGCGNGVAWELQLRRGGSRQILDKGQSQGPQDVPFKLPESVALVKGDVVCLVISPKDGNHACDLTKVQMTFEETSSVDRRTWDLARDLSGNLAAANPQSDKFGNQSVWHFFSEPVASVTGPVIPQDSLLARWQAAGDSNERAKLVGEIGDLISGKTTGDISQSNQQLASQLKSLGGPLMAYPLRKILGNSELLASRSLSDSNALVFGKLPDGTMAESASLYALAPKVLEVRLPAALIAGAEFVTAGQLSGGNPEGSVQLTVTTDKSQASISQTAISYTRPVIVSQDSAAHRKFLGYFEDFRSLFPIALCYTKIVPADEVVTLMLHYREDEALQRLILNEGEIDQLNRLWDELYFVSRDALALVDVYEQLWQYATQDGDPSVFEPLKQPILDRAAAYKQQLLETQPAQLDALAKICEQAFRRPLSEQEVIDFQKLYQTLRAKDVDHEQAVQFLIARIFSSPAFLYRMESGTGPVKSLADGEVHIRRLSNHELATRLSYFLTSAPPDRHLRELADNGELVNNAETLDREMLRLLQSPLARNLATEFGCQWLQVYDFASHDEKSETEFPTFGDLKGRFYEESILYWTDLFQRDLPVPNLLDSDYTFVDEALASHYGLEASANGEKGWRRVDGIRQKGRGGVLTMASILSKQAGASRTSPILRGNWISEVLLGDKLPSPPLNVPVLPETPPQGLNERQLIEAHSQNPACAKCHVKIDPYGFAMEGYDAIGRKRDPDQHDTSTTLYDGTKVDGVDDLREYLLTVRRDAFLRQFCRKLLGYSLGRAVQLSDKPVIDEMMKELFENEYRVTSAVRVILRSQQFQFVRVDSTE